MTQPIIKESRNFHRCVTGTNMNQVSNVVTVYLPLSDLREKNWSSQSHWQHTSIHILKIFGTSWQSEALSALRISCDFRNYFSFWYKLTVD